MPKATSRLRPHCPEWCHLDHSGEDPNTGVCHHSRVFLDELLDATSSAELTVYAQAKTVWLSAEWNWRPAARYVGFEVAGQAITVTPSEARSLAAALVRAADAVEQS